MRKLVFALLLALLSVFPASADPSFLFSKGTEYEKSDFGLHVHATDVGYTDVTASAPDSVVCFITLEYNSYMANGKRLYEVGPYYYKFPYAEMVPQLTIEFTDGTAKTLYFYNSQYRNYSWDYKLMNQRRTDYYSWGYYPLTENIFKGKTIRSVKATTRDGDILMVRNITDPAKFVKITKELEKGVDKAIKKSTKKRSKSPKK